MTPHSVKIGLVQMAMGADREANVAKAGRQVADAARRGARIVCLPELFATRYFCQVEDPDLFALAEPLPGPTTQAIAAAAKEHGVTVVAPFFEQRAAGIYHNSLVVLGPGGERLGMYRKMHIPDDPLFYEKYYFAPGDLGFVSVATPHAAIGTLICWDQWYPEAARLTALQGAEILFYPTAIGWHPGEKAQFGAAQLAAWQTIQRSHAIANGVFVAAVNRVGHERPAGREGGDGLEFWGHSFVADPFGTVLAEAGEGEETLVVDLDLSRPEEVRRNWPFLRDRRIDAYGGITSRFIGPASR
jgi:N-carbamoylputrescine amidase